MPGSLHFEAPTALQYFATLVAEDASLSPLEAAVCVAQDEYPQLDVQSTLDEVDQMAGRLRRRVPADAGPLQRLRLLNHYFFQELGFAGNVNDYYDARNSYLPDVLRTRRGIPITLALVYVELAGEIDLNAVGVCFPGHFLVKLHMPRGDVVIDPFNGQSLSREALDDRLQPYRRQRGLTGEYDAPLGLFLQPAAPRDVVARLLRNLKEIHRTAEDWGRLLAVLDRLVVLLPDVWEERRDRGLVLAELGRFDDAVTDLDHYLRGRPQAADVAALRQRQADLRAGGPRWH